jgi:hypothetical protein
MSGNRVFSNNTLLNYNEYTSQKVGKSLLENIYKRGPYSGDSNYTVKQNIITQFFDYNTFLLLSKAYFNSYECCNNKNFKPPTTIFNATNSVLCYESLLSHIKDCDHCCNCNNIYEINKCKGIKNILYPYGLYFNDEINLFYPDRLDLNKISLCKKYPVNIDNPCKRPCKRRCEEPCCKPKCMPCVDVYYPPFLKGDFNPNYRYIERKNCCSKLKCRDRCCCRENKIFYPSQYNFHETSHENKNNAFIQQNISAFSNYPKN